MRAARTAIIAIVTMALAASTAFASWYDDYDAGIAAARKGQWSAVVQKMSAAIRGNGKEDDHARTYGAIFVNYHPYYYRGVANLNLGNYQAAIDDLDKTGGPGEYNLGSLDVLHQRAQSKLESMSEAPAPAPVTPAPAPVTRPVIPTPAPAPVTPAAPSIDPALRSRAAAAVNTARQHLASATQRHANASPQFGQATNALADANTRIASARSNDDLNQAITVAENAALFADAATAPGAPPVAHPPVIVQTRPSAATDVVLGDQRRRVRAALDLYFRGEFDDAARQLGKLSQELPTNAWVWAFLGASQYSQYAFEADESYRTAAMASFRKAKALRPAFRNGLPSNYFSKKIRAAFERAS
jgi:tetratricopeptide (TPR) repeat protein